MQPSIVGLQPSILESVPLPPFQPMLLGRKVEPFDHPEFIFEPKYDGFRSLAVICDGRCTLMSRNGNSFNSFEGLRLALPTDLRVRNAIIDGEICCLDTQGRAVFDDLFYHRREPVFIAFDLLSVQGRICRGCGKALFEAACEHDLEGIVAKHKRGAYVSERNETTWFKIRNRCYSQWDGRNEMFDRPHEPRPAEIAGWDSCAMACAAAPADDSL